MINFLAKILVVPVSNTRNRHVSWNFSAICKLADTKQVAKEQKATVAPTVRLVLSVFPFRFRVAPRGINDNNGSRGASRVKWRGILTAEKGGLWRQSLTLYSLFLMPRVGFFFSTTLLFASAVYICDGFFLHLAFFWCLGWDRLVKSLCCLCCLYFREI